MPQESRFGQRILVGGGKGRWGLPVQQEQDRVDEQVEGAVVDINGIRGTALQNGAASSGLEILQWQVLGVEPRKQQMLRVGSREYGLIGVVPRDTTRGTTGRAHEQGVVVSAARATERL